LDWDYEAFALFEFPLVSARSLKEMNGSSRSKMCSKGRHFDRQIIVLCVSWYTSFKLSLRDLVIMMADRGI
jgi:transposase-like protein